MEHECAIGFRRSVCVCVCVFLEWRAEEGDGMGEEACWENVFARLAE